VTNYPSPGAPGTACMAAPEAGAEGLGAATQTSAGLWQPVVGGLAGLAGLFLLDRLFLVRTSSVRSRTSSHRGSPLTGTIRDALFLLLIGQHRSDTRVALARYSGGTFVACHLARSSVSMLASSCCGTSVNSSNCVNV